MTVTITNGWLSGSLPDDTGKEWPIVLHKQAAARGQLAAGTPDLCLHTTETDGYVETLQYPSQWQTGEGRIGQHIQLGLAGDAVNDNDAVLQQIEMVGRSKLAKWLPAEPTLGPTVALVAWLHRTGRIRSGVVRPNPDWPTVLDRGPQAVASYYRRKDGTWRKPGVYGHVEIPGNDHWDPGSFDYPVFFERVRRAIAVQEGTDVCVKCESLIDGLTAYLQKQPYTTEGPGLKVYKALQRAETLPKAEAPAPHDHPHVHALGNSGLNVPKAG